MANVVLIAGMGFGDEGKGTIVDFLARERKAKLVVRYNGGAQAAHNVITSDDRHHTFHQFGSGTFVPGCRTHLSRFMLVQPANLLAEAAELESKGINRATDLVTVDENALITTRFHAAVNRLREMSRAKGRHGSCGMGIGETVVDHLALGGTTLFAGDLGSPETLRAKLKMLQEVNRKKVAELTEMRDAMAAIEWKWLEEPESVELEAESCERFAAWIKVVPGDWLDQQLDEPGTILFEGAQGVLLDQFAGFMPYCTRSTTTFQNAHTLLEGHDVGIMRLGVIRSYLTRHGAGPMPTEDPSLWKGRPEPHNVTNPWQHDFRLGHFDMALFRYALEAIGGVDEIALTHVDRIDPHSRMCMTYDQKLTLPKSLPEQFALAELLAKSQPYYTRINPIEAVAVEMDKPVYLLSSGPRAGDKTFGRLVTRGFA